MSDEYYSIEGKFHAKRFKACYNCSALFQERHIRGGCPNCNSRAGYTSNYEGMMLIFDAAKSWVSKYEGHRKPGFYAMSVAKAPARKDSNEIEDDDMYENDIDAEGDDDNEMYGDDDDDDIISRNKKRSRQSENMPLSEKIDLKTNFGSKYDVSDDEGDEEVVFRRPAVKSEETKTENAVKSELGMKQEQQE